MGRLTQAQTNPYPNSDTNKRYYTYDYYLRRTFGAKCAKLPLDAGFTCPNIDGTCGTGGCIYCSERGSGDFAPDSPVPIREQIRMQRAALAHKWDVSRCIAYFQAHTNTYAPLPRLRACYEEALSADGIVGLNIATRADCLADDVVNYLAALAERTVLTVELGLQSSCDATAQLINRGHTYAQFIDGYERLRRASPRINLCVHIILGLPHESDKQMLATVREVAGLHPHQVKIHLLHVLRNTTLSEMYANGLYEPLTREHYIELVADALELLPQDTVIGRLTGDGRAEDLLAPDWSRKKTTVVNDIDKLLYTRNTWQGKHFGEA